MGWTTITTADEYTVRDVDPGNVLRAIAVFEDSEGVTERIVSAATDGPLAPFAVAENSPAGTVVAGSIPFDVDVGVDVNALDHRILDGAGGRFAIAGAPGDGNQYIVVANGGPSNLNYEDLQSPVDNQYQIVVEPYPRAGEWRRTGCPPAVHDLYSTLRRCRLRRLERQ